MNMQHAHTNIVNIHAHILMNMQHVHTNIVNMLNLSSSVLLLLEHHSEKSLHISSPQNHDLNSVSSVSLRPNKEDLELVLYYRCPNGSYSFT